MNTSNDNQLLPPIQLLITACAATNNSGMRLGWLHGYCLLTYTPTGPGLRVEGDVRVGEFFSENLPVIQDLADALDPAAVLAGYDLTATISQLGRLPIEANDPAPALDLLAKLRSMLERQCPIELALTSDSQTEVAVQAVCNQLGSAEGLDDPELGSLLDFGKPISGYDHADPHRLAIDLADMAGACMLALGNLCLADELRPLLETAMQKWRENVTPHLPIRHADGD